MWVGAIPLGWDLRKSRVIGLELWLGVASAELALSRRQSNRAANKRITESLVPAPYLKRHSTRTVR
jgi:hypothetical protein